MKRLDTTEAVVRKMEGKAPMTSRRCGIGSMEDVTGFLGGAVAMLCGALRRSGWHALSENRDWSATVTATGVRAAFDVARTVAALETAHYCSPRRDEQPAPSRHLCRLPEVLWAQRSDKVYLTVALPDAKDVEVKTEPEGSFTFSAAGADEGRFQIKLELYGRVIPEGSKIKVGLRNIICSILKEKKEWWNRLLKSEEKPAPYIKVDWNKWCDEDDESEYDSDDECSGENDEENVSSDDGLLYLPDLEKSRGK